MIKKFYEYIKEGKQVGLLYHTTGLFNTKQIINSNKLKGDFFGGDMSDLLGVSTTRNKNFIYGERYNNVSVQFVLDGDKISNNYKIRPYDYWLRNYGDEEHVVDEDEEIIIVNDSLVNLDKYIISINIYVKNELSNGQNLILDELTLILDDKNIKYTIKK